jgi:hypothetical protein
LEIAENAAGFPNRDNLGMSRGIVGPCHLVDAGGDDDAVAHHQGGERTSAAPHILHGHVNDLLN